MPDKRKQKIVTISNFSMGKSYSCRVCGYTAQGERAVRLHSKYSHGDTRHGRVLDYCTQCKKNRLEGM